ncbi:MAG: hypothetical protein AB8G23_09525 [Myxococcota bacterium]
MPPERKTSTHQTTRRTGGFALIAALAVLVVLGAAGGVMLRLTSLQQSGATAAILGTRAHWAARSGVEWAIHQAVGSSGCPAATTNLALTEGALSGFTVVVSCVATRHYEGADEQISLVIESQAQYGTLGSPGYVFREVRASLVL